MGNFIPTRVPSDIGGEDTGTDAHALPRFFDFTKLPDEKAQRQAAVLDYLRECLAEGLYLTGESDGAWESVEERSGIQCQYLKLAGTDIEAVRHKTDFDAPAPFVFDLYNRLNYTDIIDAYTFLVDTVEDFDTSSDGDLAWAHVVWTVDRLTFPLRSIRDFVTLDGVSKKDMLLVSRSVLHPGRPVTPVPGWGSLLGGDKDSDTYRVPLFYCLHVTSKPDGGCTVVQVQWSDVGGIVPVEQLAPSVKMFGFDNMERFRKLIGEALAKSLPLGPGKEGHLANPMKPSWRQDPSQMVPGL